MNQCILTGDLISILNVTNEHDLMIVNKSGITIRMSVEDLRVMGRATQGVRLISLRGKDEIASVCRVPKADEEENIESEEGEEGKETSGQGEGSPKQDNTQEPDGNTNSDNEK